MVRDVQYDPLTHGILHLDFQHISLTEQIEVKVTINVARSAEEAAAQARGDDLTATGATERAEMRAAAEALFEEAQAEVAAEEDAEPVSKTRPKAKAKKPDIE